MNISAAAEAYIQNHPSNYKFIMGEWPYQKKVCDKKFSQMAPDNVRRWQPHVIGQWYLQQFLSCSNFELSDLF